jgi:HPt (histidine-containing phosphotransfer) domain-containing protein
MAALDRLVGQLEQALAKNDLSTADDLAHTAMGAANDLANTGSAASTLLTSTEPARIEALRAELDTMASSMREAWFAARISHAEQIPAAMQKFRAAYAQVKNASH